MSKQETKPVKPKVPSDPREIDEESINNPVPGDGEVVPKPGG